MNTARLPLASGPTAAAGPREDQEPMLFARPGGPQRFSLCRSVDGSPVVGCMKCSALHPTIAADRAQQTDFKGTRPEGE